MVQDGDNLRFYDCEQGNELVFGDYELHLLVADEYDDEYDTDMDVDSSQPTTDLLCQPLASEPVDEDESLRSLLVQRRSHLLDLNIGVCPLVPVIDPVAQEVSSDDILLEEEDSLHDHPSLAEPISPSPDDPPRAGIPVSVKHRNQLRSRI